MYPEDDGGGGGGSPADYSPPAGGGFRGKMSRNLEGLIPLILILIIVAFLGHRFGFWEIPGLGGGEPTNVLFVGSASPAMEKSFSDNKDIVRVHYRSINQLKVSPEEQLAQFPIIILDQHLEGSKEIPAKVAEAIKKKVQFGGKLIVVMDSGIRVPGASDVLGWQATFGDVVPVRCDNTDNPLMDGCTDRRAVAGRIVRVDYKHQIMEGIDIAPAEGIAPYYLETFPVTPVGNEIAQIENVNGLDIYPGIVEKNLIVGKSIYFNYDPAITPTIWRKTLLYLK